MITIGQCTETGFAQHSGASFEQEFFKICQSHHQDDRALLFAFLLYDFSNPFVIKVLSDTDYWNSLDFISGSRISVFAFHSPTVTSAKRPLNSGQEFKNLISRFFELDERVPLPSVLFFQTDGNTVICSHLVKIKEDGIEAAFRDMRDIIGTVADSVSKVEKQNRNNFEEVFALARSALSQRNAIEVVYKAYGTITDAKKFVSLFK